MPATRTTANSRRTPSASHRSHQLLAGTSAASSSPLYLTSPMPSHPPPATRTKAKQKAIPHPMATEVIEISSDEDEDLLPKRRPVAPPKSNATDLRKDAQRLKEANDLLKTQYKGLQKELEAQKEKTRSLEIQKRTGGSSEIKLDPSDVEDIIACNVCTNTMFVPWILPGCGHTFCQKCLSDWFDTTLRNFLVGHPGYNMNNPGPHHFGYLMQHPQLANHPQLAHLIPPRPEYACPECRTPVKSRPVENFAMKSFVTLCHTATHGRPPPAVPRRGSPWEGFFPQ
ncbi:hypothetical protein FA13DRAFT_912309 [Coprinellus micaceus]|uniref:RING-type domain-containing protein n=1 Tax=Coprinellus micaceus TaxID=71717 RepID=A0A4Y7TVB0_COPMI|nr:hypothetical protein FA13DRAFT_912309 [Coprinellus micaceus]